MGFWEMFWNAYLIGGGVTLAAYLINHRRALNKKELGCEVTVAFIPVINILMAVVELTQLCTDEYMAHFGGKNAS